MLQNEPTLAIGGVDTAGNGPSKVRQVTNKVCRNIGAVGIFQPGDRVRVADFWDKPPPPLEEGEEGAEPAA